jgi:hypothetical protein
MVLENVLFPAQVLGSLGLGEGTSVTAVRLFLARFREEAGAAGDGIERILLDQLVVAHLKVGELYALAAGATNLEFKALYHNTAARLLTAVCQLVATIGTYRASTRPRRRTKGRRAAPAVPTEPSTIAVPPAVREEKVDSQLASKSAKGDR